MVNHHPCWVNSPLYAGEIPVFAVPSPGFTDEEDLGMSFAVLRHIRDQFKVGHGVR